MDDPMMNLYHNCMKFCESFTNFIHAHNRIYSEFCPPHHKGVYMNMERERLQHTYLELVDSVKKCEEDRKGEVKFD